MESKRMILNPVLWRLFTRNFLIVFIPPMIVLISVNLYVNLFNPTYSFFWQFTLYNLIAGLISATIASAVQMMSCNILISEGKISGPRSSMMWKKEVFSLVDLDIAGLDISNPLKQSFCKKMYSFRRIRSITGQEITLINFIYKESELNELYRILENEYF